MRTQVLIWLLALVLVSNSYSVDENRSDVFTRDFSKGLSAMGMTARDLRIRHDYARPDVFRLPLVDSLMHNPASLLKTADILATRVETEESFERIGSFLWEAMSVKPQDLPGVRRNEPEIRDVVGRFAHLPEDLRQPISDYLLCLGEAVLLRDRAVSEVRPHLEFLYENAPSLVTYRQEYESVGPFELHRLENEEQAIADSVLRLSEKMDVGALREMSLVAVRGAERLRQAVEGNPPPKIGYERYRGGRCTFSGFASAVTGRIIYMGLTGIGPVVVGGTSENTYSGSFALVIDLGGDDTYAISEGQGVNFDLIIDIKGEDIYRAAGGSVAGKIFGTSVVMDLTGDDYYRSDDVSFGAAVYGGALLYDGDGDDSYTSGAFSQGAGFLGVGILCDERGNDTYMARMQSQGFGYVMGSGLILEKQGNDTYFISMANTDILRYDDHYLTLSQGCGFGSRPDYSGGIGLLVDSGGNDLYSTDIFGQGVAYWFAVGALIDRTGHDRYCSYQYAQGSGVHLAFGLLLDERGNDFYQSKGVSQGCGHDLSLGLLADMSGNDCYTAVDLSQGAGNANGTGILYDADGTDSYSSKSVTNVNGYGDYRREFGSIGLHLDAHGRDFYSARGGDEYVWESGMYGLGIDISGESDRPRGDLIVNEYRFEAREFSADELFILSARGEPRFRRWREYAFDKMVKDSASTIDYLSTVLDTKDARERHTIKDILREIGEPAVSMLSEAVLEGNDRARAEAAWILGLIGSRSAFDALLDLSHSESWKLRSTALNSLGKLKDVSTAEKEYLSVRLTEILTDADEVFYVKKDAAFAAGRQRLCELVPLLVHSLESDHYSTRYSAAEALRALSEDGCDGLSDAIMAGLADLDTSALIAALHASGKLPHDVRLDIADTALDLPQLAHEEASFALAKMLRDIEPANSAEEEQLGKIKERLLKRSWIVKAVLR